MRTGKPLMEHVLASMKLHAQPMGPPVLSLPASQRAPFYCAQSVLGQSFWSSILSPIEPQSSGCSANVLGAGCSPNTEAWQGKLAIVFTCSKCNTRAVKAFSKQAYESGLVLIRCPGCSGIHLIADRLGWFGDKTNIEEIMAEKGGSLRKADASKDAIDIHDALGDTKVKQIIDSWVSNKSSSKAEEKDKALHGRDEGVLDLDLDQLARSDDAMNKELPAH